MIMRDSLGRFTGNKYKKINGKWYRSKCEDCGDWVQRLNQKWCWDCYTKRPQPTIADKGKWNIGKKRTEEQRKRIGEARKGKGLHPGINYSKQSGETHHNWKGGITTKNMLIRKSYEYKVWRKAVFERDNYICQHCGVRGGVILHADHIKPFSTHSELRFDVDNGRTLCKPCHMQTPTYGRKAQYV